MVALFQMVGNMKNHDFSPLRTIDVAPWVLGQIKRLFHWVQPRLSLEAPKGAVKLPLTLAKNISSEKNAN